MQVVLLPARAFRTQAPPPLLAGFGGGGVFLVGSGPAAARLRSRIGGVGQHVERFQPGRAPVVAGKGHPLPEVRRHVRPRQFAGVRAELDGMPLAGMRRFILGPLNGRLPLGQGRVGFPGVIPHRAVVGQNLALLVVRVAGLAFGRQHVFHPVLDVDDRGFLRPLALAFVHDLELLAEPVHGPADQLVGRDPLGDPPFAVGKLLERRHHVCAAEGIIAVLQGVVHPPVPPHARDVVMRHMAVEQKVPRQPLAQPGTAFGLQVQRFRRTNDFHVHPVTRGANDRILHRTVVRRGDHVFDVRLPFRRPHPADRSAVRMVGMKHLAAAVDQPELGRIAQVRPRNGRRGISKGVGTIRQRFVLKVKQFFLDGQVVDPERLAAVVQGARRGPVGVRLRIPLRDHFPVPVERTERFVPHLVVEQDEFPEVLGVVVGNHHHPAAVDRLACPRTQVARPVRLDHKGTDQPQGGWIAARMALDQMTAFLLVDRDVPFEFLRLSRMDDRAGSRRGGGFPGGADDHRGTVDLEPDVLELDFVGDFDPNAVALIRAEDQRLNRIPLQAVRDRTRINRIFPGGGVLFFFLAHLGKVLGQREHVPGEKVPPLVQGDLDVDRRHVIELDGSRAGTMRSFVYLVRCLGRSQQITLTQLMRGPGIMKTAAGRGRSGVFLDLGLQLVHQAHEGLIHPVLTAFHAAHHFFIIDLILQLVQPGRAFCARLGFLFLVGWHVRACRAHEGHRQ